MKKLFTFAIAAMALFAISCNPEGSEDGAGNATAEDIVGHWGIAHEDGAEELVIEENGTISGDFCGEGTWTLKNGVLTVVGKDYEGKDVTTAFKVDMLYEKTVLVLRFDIPATDEAGHYIGTNNGEGEVYFFFRDGKAKANDIKDIQGKWYWLMQRNEGYVRAAFIINGNDADVIITVWGERYKGKAQYKDGRLIVEKQVWMTSRYDEIDHVDECASHPENAEWKDITGNTEGYSISDIEINFPFIANGNEAYCILANLPAVMIKQ